MTTVRDFKTRSAMLIMFENKGYSDKARQNDALLSSYFAAVGSRFKPVTAPAEDLGGIWAQIISEVLTTFKEVGHPIHAVVDLSSCPRYFTLALLTVGFATGMVGKVTYVYTEAEYGSEQRTDLFTVGRWEDVEIPGPLPSFEPGRPRLYVVSVGFEGAKTLRFVNRADPDRLEVLFPDPGYRADYASRTWKQNAGLFSEYKLTPKSRGVVRAPAGDAVQAWKLLHNSHASSSQHNAYYLCCGTKAHSVALALRAMSTGGILLYPRPPQHRESDIQAGSEHWKYVIDDRSAITQQPTVDANSRVRPRRTRLS